MVDFLAVEPAPLAVRTVTADHRSVYVVPKCNPDAAHLVCENDPFILLEITSAGSLNRLATLVVSQPANDRGTLVLRVDSVVDENTISALRHMAGKKDLTVSLLRAYRVQAPQLGHGLTSDELMAAIAVIDRFADELDCQVGET